MMLGELGPLDLTGSTTVSSRDSDTDTQLSPARCRVLSGDLNAVMS